MHLGLGPNGLIHTITASGTEAIRLSAKVLSEQMQIQAKLKFGLYALAALFVIVAAFLVVFAPEGRETVSAIVAVALFVVAVGCAGFGTFTIKTPVVSAEAGKDVFQATINRPTDPEPPIIIAKPRSRRPAAE